MYVFFLASRAFKSPGAEGPRRRVVSLFLASRDPEPEQSWDYCRSCQSCQEQLIARARLSRIYSDDAEAACPFASSAIASPSRKHSGGLGSCRQNRNVGAWKAQV